MLEAVTVSSSGGSVDLSLWDYSEGYFVTTIEGLGPVNSSLSFVDRALFDGSRFQHGRRGSRNIVITAKLLTGFYISVTDLRKQLYSVMTPNREVDLIFRRDNEPDLTISGIVETVENDMFTADPTIVFSIICPDPNFVQSSETVTWSTTSTATTHRRSVNYEGTVPTGVLLVAERATPMNSPTFRNDVSGEIQTLSLTTPQGAYDNIQIDTRDRSRGVTSNTAGTNILTFLNQGSDWITLMPGTNDLTYSFSQTTSGQLKLTLYYDVLQDYV